MGKYPISSPGANPAGAVPFALVSQCTVYPSSPSTLGLLKLSVSDLPMLSCHYIQKGLLFPTPPLPAARHLIPLLQLSLSRALSHFPPLAGKLVTDSATGRIFVSCQGDGVPFSHWRATTEAVTLPSVLFSGTPAGDVPGYVRGLFDLDGIVGYDGHSRPLAAVRVTELADGSIFVGCTVNHAVVDGTSFWNFFNSWAELCRTVSGAGISKEPDFTRNFFGSSTAVLRLPGGKSPAVTFPVNDPLCERIFHFSSSTIRELKEKANSSGGSISTITAAAAGNDHRSVQAMSEVCRKQIHDDHVVVIRSAAAEPEISSFQSLCALLWKHVTQARKLLPGATTTFRMAVNCRHRVEPRVHDYYFGNAIQSVPTVAAAREVRAQDLSHTAEMLRKSVAGYDNKAVKRAVEEWEERPRCFPLGNPDGSVLTMGSSPRFPMYDNNFGWGRPVAVRSGSANKFDGKVSAFPGRDGGGSVDLEVCLKPETMDALLADSEFMAYVSKETHEMC